MRRFGASWPVALNRNPCASQPGSWRRSSVSPHPGFWHPLCASDKSAGHSLVADKGSQTLSIVDAATGSQVGTVAENGNTGHEVAATPDGTRAFVPIYGSGGVGSKGTDGQLIRVVDLAKREVAGTIDFGRGIRPHCPVFGPDGLLYVTTELENSVTVIDPGFPGDPGKHPDRLPAVPHARDLA